MNAIEKVQLILHFPQLQHRTKQPEPVIPGPPDFVNSLEDYSEKSVHEPNGNTSYLYGVVRDELVFEQVVIYYTCNQISFSYEQTDTDISEQLLRLLKKEQIEYRPLSKTFFVDRGG